jgi:3-dehydroquinate synthase
MALKNKKSQLQFIESLPRLDGTLAPENAILIFDQKLLKVSSEFKKWSSGFIYKYPVASGEELKDLKHFALHAAQLFKICKDLSPRAMTVVSVGGGSVGDFSGFFASVYKRGVNLVHIPSTWLAAIDSSHGGKTALNVGGAKNQIGTFYPASEVILAKSLLMAQPSQRIEEAMGEFGKIALISGSAWVKKLANSNEEDPAALLWKFLKPAIQAKLKVVDSDPLEQNGERQILNLGHTVGHVLESEFGWAHGRAVAQGLFFALEFSEHSGLLSEKANERAMKLLSESLGLHPIFPKSKISVRRFVDLMLKDKKKSSQEHLTFIFLKAMGRPLRATLHVDELVLEAQRQGIVGDES